MMLNRICRECGKPFEVDVNSRFICSDECLKVRVNRQKREYDKKNRAKTIYKTCPECGDIFIRTEKRRKICSDECKAVRLKRQYAIAYINSKSKKFAKKLEKYK